MLQQKRTRSPELLLGRECEPSPAGRAACSAGSRPRLWSEAPIRSPLPVGVLNHHPGKVSAGFFHNLEVWKCPSHACSS